jgi:hypothetical protein
LIKHFNDQKNQGQFNALFHNCADLARTILNFYYPDAVHRNLFADADITTPKQVAKSLVSYCRHHPEVPCSSFAISQVPGSIRRSEPAHGVLEVLVKAKKYVIPLAIVSPPVAGGIALLYLAEGRFNPKSNAETFDIGRAVQPQSAGLETSMVAAPQPASLTPSIALKVQSR